VSARERGEEKTGQPVVRPAAASFAKPDPNDVVLVARGSAQYDSLRLGFNKRIDKHPRVIALCKNTNGVTQAIGYAAASTD
jgi:hypothetical protein